MPTAAAKASYWTSEAAEFPAHVVNEHQRRPRARLAIGDCDRTQIEVPLFGQGRGRLRVASARGEIDMTVR
jgi:hypothetical protein